MLPPDGTELSPAEIVERYPHMKERMADFEEGSEAYVLLEQMPEDANFLIQNGRKHQQGEAGVPPGAGGRLGEKMHQLWGRG